MDDLSFLITGFLGAVVCAVAGATILSRVDREGAGLALGFFLGPIGLVIAWVMRDNALREEEERRRRHHPIDEYMRALKPPPAAPEAPRALSPIEELERLAALRERGHVPEDEFNRRKSQLLGSAPVADAPPPRRFR